MNGDFGWSWYSFDELQPRLWHKIARLRQEVFIVEQRVAYSDLDDRDCLSRHLVCTLSGEVVAYLRILPLGIFKASAFSFGRVVVRRDLRRVGLGRSLVAKGLRHLEAVRQDHHIEISSQFYLKDFYKGFGFEDYGDPYVEDEILHIAMRKT